MGENAGAKGVRSYKGLPYGPVDPFFTRANTERATTFWPTRAPPKVLRTKKAIISGSEKPLARPGGLLSALHWRHTRTTERGRGKMAGDASPIPPRAHRLQHTGRQTWLAFHGLPIFAHLAKREKPHP